MEQVIDLIKVDFQQMVNHAPNIVWLVNKNKTILWCNDNGLQILNLAEEDVLHKNVLCFIPTHLHELIKNQLESVFDKKEALDPKEIKIYKSREEIIDAELIVAPHYFEGEFFAHIIIRDITGRKVREKLLHDSEKLASLGQITAGIIHEIKNPLTAVKGFLQLANESYSRFYLETAESELNKALETIQNLLQVSKPGFQDEPFVPIHVSKELRSMMPLFQDKMYSIEMEMDIRDEDVIITGKRNSLQKAFFNLIKNAIEAIEGNGKVTIEHYLQDEWIHIKLSDTGVGIPPDKLKTLGTPFYSTKADGTGLGLTQVCTTIHDHGGIIEVDSILGEGTTFHIQFPFNFDPIKQLD